jgi:beta-hydroxylase
MNEKKLLHDPKLLEKIDIKSLPGFYDISCYPFLYKIEQNYAIIKQELDMSLNSQALFQMWPQEQMTNHNPETWKIIPIHARTNWYNQLDKLSVYDSYFPKTLEILNKVLGNDLCDVAFSKLSAKSKIQPHNGRFSNVLRCHLGLQIPEGDCKIVANGTTKQWEEGRLLIFNEALEHTAWNNTDHERIILMFDFIPDNYSDFFPTQTLESTNDSQPKRNHRTY